MSNFLSFLYSDIRNSIYKNHIEWIQRGLLDQSHELSRSKFSFINFHMNIGNVRTYSTSSILRQDVLKNRQQLFQNNYNRINEILHDNYYIGSIKVQKEIEKKNYINKKVFFQI